MSCRRLRSLERPRSRRSLLAFFSFFSFFPLFSFFALAALGSRHSAAAAAAGAAPLCAASGAAGTGLGDDAAGCCCCCGGDGGGAGATAPRTRAHASAVAEAAFGAAGLPWCFGSAASAPVPPSNSFCASNSLVEKGVACTTLPQLSWTVLRAPRPPSSNPRPVTVSACPAARQIAVPAAEDGSRTSVIHTSESVAAPRRVT